MKLKNGIIISIGVLAVLIGAIGIVIPVWPTTPFILLAVGCFSRAPKLRKMLLRISFFKEYYESYTQGEGLTKPTVARSLVFLWVMLGISCLLAGTQWITLMLVAIGTAVSVHILYMAKIILIKGR